MTAAPLGAPPLPTVEPTPQHFEAVTQVTATIELTGVGAATGSNEPLHGDPEANAMVAWVVDGVPTTAGPFEQAVAPNVSKITNPMELNDGCNDGSGRGRGRGRGRRPWRRNRSDVMVVRRSQN